MADVQLAHGYVSIPRRVLEAILAAPFHGTQLSILLVLARLTWGWRSSTVRLRVEDLAKLAGVSNSGGFRRQLDELVAEGVLRRSKARGKQPTTYALVTDFEAWGRFAIDEHELAARWAFRPDPGEPFSDLPTDPALRGDSASGVLAPSLPLQGGSTAPTGQDDCPSGGSQDEHKSSNSNDFAARKDRKDRKDTTAATSSPTRARAMESAEVVAVLEAFHAAGVAQYELDSLREVLAAVANPRAWARRWAAILEEHRHPDQGAWRIARAVHDLLCNTEEGTVPRADTFESYYRRVLESEYEAEQRERDYAERDRAITAQRRWWKRPA